MEYFLTAVFVPAHSAANFAIPSSRSARPPLHPPSVRVIHIIRRPVQWSAAGSVIRFSSS